MSKNSPRSDDRAADLPLMMAAEAHRVGNLAEAERFFRMALQAAPAHPQAMAMLGVVLAQRGRPEEGVSLLAKVVKRQPEYGSWFNYASVLRAAGHSEQAAGAFVKAAQLRPDDPRAFWEAGLAFRTANLLENAAAAFDRVAQLDPANPAPWIESGRAHLALGHAADGVERLREALRRGEADGDICRAVAQSLGNVEFTRHDPQFEAVLGRWATMPDPKPAWFAPRLLALVKLDPALAPLLASARDGFADAAVEDGSLQPLFACVPLRQLMAVEVLPDPEIETLLLAARRTLTRVVADGGALTPDARAFLLALALLSHTSDFAMAKDPMAADLPATLAVGLAGDLAARLPIDRLAERLAVVACHRPLARLPVAAKLAELAGQTAEPLLARLLTVAVVEPLREDELRQQIVSLTPIDEPATRPHDEWPFPRWLTPPPATGRFAEAMHRAFPFAALSPSAFAPRRVLVAGCGTGWPAFAAARRYPNADIVAVDASPTNLGYALRAQEKFGCPTVAFRRADVMRLADLEDRFDLIESNGALHALADPEAGWSQLNTVLRPGGLLRINLHSAVARHALHVVEGFVAEHGLTADADGLRAFRAAALALPEDHPLRPLLRSADFYALSSLRHLAFHGDERRFTLPELTAALARLDLRFVGFELLYPQSRGLYRQRFPDDPAMTDLEHWAAFEEEFPRTFLDGYDFWCVKVG